GLWQPGSGWLSPPAVCRALLRQPNIVLQENCGALQFTRAIDGDWEARDRNMRLCASAPLLILATGTDSRINSLTDTLPLRVVRGQTTQIPAPADQTLLTSLCHRGYIAPAINGEHCIGATFKPGDDGRALRVEEHAENLSALAKALPAWQSHLASLDPRALRGRAELRCVSPDYLPLAGPLPAENVFRERYAALTWDAKQIIPTKGAYEPGLYLSSAHGSRGLSYAPMSAELIAAQIFAEPLPISRELQRALSPARFLIRDLIRGTAQKKVVSA
ncbi:MAG: FAD-dependent 5-carboxymethylaminomethyl-2-thiouridine(34) oxidoreductase MnmC, partial [Congregibacter sp.]|nr:FAD-dependent 5-carboxymethylaminomethyl-2-thiouridine(34) oxidoreductase MnmC [Congregibacter sp.]